LHDQIASGTIDAPTWDNVRASRTAAKIYAPIGTQMSLGDFVRITKKFSEAFKASPDLDDLFQDLQVLNQPASLIYEFILNAYYTGLPK
jgi:glycerol-3-phosphate O-acyltransferase / dihydroxyacetone phosphate acyltransferase